MADEFSCGFISFKYLNICMNYFKPVEKILRNQPIFNGLVIIRRIAGKFCHKSIRISLRQMEPFINWYLLLDNRSVLANKRLFFSPFLLFIALQLPHKSSSYFPIKILLSSPHLQSHNIWAVLDNVSFLHQLQPDPV